jgi:hypothetical protein
VDHGAGPSVREELGALLADRRAHQRLLAVALRVARAPADAEDLIQTACEKLLSGERARNRDEYPELVAQLGSIMSSEGSHAGASADARHQRLHADPDDEGRAPDERGDAETRNLREAADQRTERKLAYRFHGLRAACAGDPQCLRLVDCFEAKQITAAAQQTATGWPLADVRRVRRRVFYRAEQVRREQPDDSGRFAVPEAS